MASRISFSADIVDIGRIDFHHRDVVASLNSYFSAAVASNLPRFVGYTNTELSYELVERLEEVERSSAMTLLSAIEAAFRIDFLQRCYLKKKDPVSRAFRNLHAKRQLKVAIDDDIFEIWKENTIGASALIGELRGAFRYRHWLAHGRYWTPKLGRKYDYVSVYELAESALKSFPLFGLG